MTTQDREVRHTPDKDLHGYRITTRSALWLTLGVGAVAGAAIAYRVLQPADRRAALAEELRHGLERTRHSGSRLLDEGKKGVRAVQEESKDLKDYLEQHLPRRKEKNSVLGKISEHESAVAVFMATLLAKGASSYLEWRDAQHARRQGRRVAAAPEPREASDTEA